MKEFPDELQTVFSYIDPGELSHISAVSRSYNHNAKEVRLQNIAKRGYVLPNQTPNWFLPRASYITWFDQITSMLGSNRAFVRRDALSLLEPSSFAPHVATVVRKLDDEESYVRHFALNILLNAEPSSLALHTVSIVTLVDTEAVVRTRALELLGRLDPPSLALHANSVVRKLVDTEAVVRVRALELLGRLDPPSLALHTVAIVGKLGDEEAVVRIMALKILGKLDPQDFARHTTAVALRLGDEQLIVRDMAAVLLRHMTE